MALNAFTTTDLTRADAGFTNNSDVTDATILLHVNAANGEVNTAIGGRYTLPFSGSSYTGSLTEGYLKQLATTLAAGFLLLKQYEGMGGAMEDLAIAKIESARSQLKEIQKGARSLIDSDGNEFDLRNSSRSSIDGFPNDSEANPSVYDMDDKF